MRIPKAIAEEACVKQGDAIVIRIARGHIELLRTEPIPALEQVVAKITPETAIARRIGDQIAGRNGSSGSYQVGSKRNAGQR